MNCPSVIASCKCVLLVNEHTLHECECGGQWDKKGTKRLPQRFIGPADYTMNANEDALAQELYAIFKTRIITLFGDIDEQG